ncbi:PIG-L deacetylase family protein [Streptomyces sp. NPDC046866]|uniref:PIG-L deacetylase family protein n=1 Tax=Streptomyces sp. NPDC046866 TaxID=3154921 RepID=UPI0034551940
MPEPPSPPAVLAVFAHPDDESLVAGGVLARHAAAGARTAVVTATWSAGSHRAAELADALAVLGAGEPRLLGYADARIPQSAPLRPRFCDAPMDEAVARLVSHVRRFRPDIVVTHDAHGGLTGHPDHVHTHRVTALAVHAAGIEHLYRDCGPPWRPRALYLATHPASGAGALGGLLAGVGKPVLTVPDEQITATVDVGPWLEQKWAAVLAHRSEVQRDRSLPAVLSRLPEDVRRGILTTEWYTRLDIRSAAGDLRELTA